jgi:hypothetical protein
MAVAGTTVAPKKLFTLRLIRMGWTESRTDSGRQGEFR